MNKSEIFNWNGKIPISDYPIFQDLEPEIIIKKSQKQVEYIQGLAIRYLKPPTPPPAGDIIITQEPDVIIKPAPPIIIRQLPVIILMIIIKFRSIIKFKTYVSATTIDTKTFNNPGKTTKSSSNRKQKSNYNIW